MTEELSSLLGPTVDVRAERLAERQQREIVKNAALGRGQYKAKQFLLPVSQNFLVEVWGMDPETVKKRLLKCPVVGTHANRDVYDFKTACEYLLKPRMDIETFLKTLNPADMPNAVNKTFWEALRGKLKFQIEAGEAWATEDVLDVFGRVFMTIKERTKLWVENVRETAALGDEGNQKFTEMVDDYLTNLHSELIEIPKARQTRSKAAEIEGLNTPERFDADDEA